MFRPLCLAALMACARTPTPVEPAAPDPSDTREPLDISTLLEPVRTEHNLPALAGAVIDADGLRLIGATGTRKVSGTDSVTLEDRWHLGSDTKAMTATLIAALVEDGTLEWSTRISDVWPDAHAGWSDVTLQDLLQHRGGASSSLGAQHPALWGALWRANSNPNGQAARATFATELLSLAPDHPPGQFHYSNAGYMLAGAMAESKTGTSWQALMTTRIFEPLSMTDCGFGAPPDPAPWGHTASGTSLTPMAPGPMADNPPGLGPAGTVHCSLKSWGRFIGAHLRRGSEADPLLPRAAWDRLHEPNGSYAMGWAVSNQPWAGGTALAHAGSNTMWYANVWVAHETDRAFLVTTNAAPGNAPQAIDQATIILRDADRER